MCIIIHRTGGHTAVPQDVLDFNHTRYTDGTGLAWREHGKLVTAKWGPQDYPAFLTQLRDLQRHKGEFGAHYRLATTGKVVVDNSHPHLYTDPQLGDVAVFHNGVIDIATPKDGSMSDTAVFVRDVLAHLPSGWWRSPAHRWLVESSIGWSRLLIMTAHDSVRLGDGWVERTGKLHYSLTPERPAPVVPKATVGGAYGRGAWPGKDRYQKWWGEHTAATQVKPAAATATTATASVTGQGWVHAGHWVERVPGSSVVVDDDTEQGDVRCVSCGVTGEYWVIDDKPIIDVRHVVPPTQLTQGLR